MINKREQRLNCLLSLWAVRNYLKYPIENHPRNYDQLGAEVIFKERWKNSVLLRIVVNMILPALMFLMDIYLFLKYSWRLLRHQSQQLQPDTLLVSCHHRLYRIGIYAGLINDESVWFHTPMDSFVLPKDYKTLTVFDYVTLADIWNCMVQSVCCRWIFIRRKGYENFMLTLKCFEWLLTDIALRKVSPEVELVFSNQLDRLAVLIDKLPQKRKSLVEHGVEYLYNESEIQKKNDMLVYCPDVEFYVLNRTYHFHTLTRVYCYSETDIKAFEHSIVRCNPEYIVIGYDFKPSFKPNKKSVLIISEYYNQYENEKKVISLLQGLDVEVYLKGHPGNDDSLYDELRYTYSFVFIAGKDKNLPDADIVISYDSTLAHEYESVGSKVMYYGEFDIENVREIISETLRVKG